MSADREFDKDDEGKQQEEELGLGGKGAGDGKVALGLEAGVRVFSSEGEGDDNGEASSWIGREDLFPDKNRPGLNSMASAPQILVS